MKRIMSEKKTALPSLRNQDWKTVKAETEKINDILSNISTNDITELNDLIYAGAKLVCENVGFLLKNTKRKSKPRGKIRLETQLRNLRQQVKMLRQKENMRSWDKKRKQHK